MTDPNDDDPRRSWPAYIAQEAILLATFLAVLGCVLWLAFHGLLT